MMMTVSTKISRSRGATIRARRYAFSIADTSPSIQFRGHMFLEGFETLIGDPAANLWISVAVEVGLIVALVVFE